MSDSRQPSTRASATDQAASRTHLMLLGYSGRISSAWQRQGLDAQHGDVWTVSEMSTAFKQLRLQYQLDCLTLNT